MFRAFGGLSLRAKVMGTFVSLVLGGTAVSTLLGSRIITQELLAQERKRVYHGVDAANLVFRGHLERMRVAVSGIASGEPLLTGVSTGSRLLSLERLHQLDALILIDPVGRRMLRGEGMVPLPTGFGGELETMARRAERGESQVATLALSAGTLARLSPKLAKRARISIPGAQPLTSGLLMVAATPVGPRPGSRGVLLGAVLLNRNRAVVDEIREVIYGGEKYQGIAIGAVSVFLGEVRIASNIHSQEVALGTLVSPEVAEAVLRRGDRWGGSAEVLGEDYATAYEPIRDPSRKIVGILGVGMQAAPYLAVRTSMMVTFLGVAVGGVLIVLVITYLITRSMIGPLEEMARAAERIAAGNLDQRVHVPERDEVGLLAAAFNKMVEALRAAHEESEQWTHTLGEKVRERTEELVAVQTQMAQAEKLASLGRVAAGVAHEINNPLGGILTFASLAVEDCPPGHPLHNNLDIIVKQSLRCRDIVKGLLAFSRQSQSSPSLTSAHTILDATLHLFENQALFHNVEIVRRYAKDLPEVFIDPGQLQQVVMNVVLNAVDAMEGKGRLTIVTSARDDERQIELQVTDTGKGIPSETLPLIFEPFFTTKPVGKGTGLGLAIVHGIVTRAGGQISVDTSPTGTTITVNLPYPQALPEE